jgi:hypothetical protein
LRSACVSKAAETTAPNSALVADACAAALLRRAFFGAAQRER